MYQLSGISWKLSMISLTMMRRRYLMPLMEIFHGVVHAPQGTHGNVFGRAGGANHQSGGTPPLDSGWDGSYCRQFLSVRSRTPATNVQRQTRTDRRIRCRRLWL